ncbi:hypothetical protein [Paenibacillus piscarius]|uniref:hypothetical protein n=1 Tax=Paenibacillus piscarius TaxID=1089681 RepID=UPI001EE7F02A|nr:hypothetical protein [Paenibacillus piscarius]
MKKTLTVLSLVGLLLSSFSATSASAQSSSVTEATYLENESSAISPFAIIKYPGAGTYYQPLSTTSTKFSHFNMRSTNYGDVTTQVVRTVTMRKYAQLTVGGEFELNIIATKVNTSVEVQAGLDYTVSTSVTWNVPGKSVYDLSAGEEVVRTIGYIEIANTSGVVVQQKSVTAEYTSREYSDAVLVSKL